MTRAKIFMSCIAILGALCPSLVPAGAPVARLRQQMPLQVGPELVQVFSGLSGPVYITNAHDRTNRLFILEKPGRIRVAQPGATTTSVFLDITSAVESSGGEQGLLGLAFHPQF